MSTRSTVRAIAMVAVASLSGLLVVAAGPTPAAQAATGDITAFSANGLWPQGGIVEGPDGNVYFANPYGSGATNGIGRITPQGAITFFSDASIDQINDLTVGGDGNLWLTDTVDNEILRFNLSTHVFTTFAAGVIFPWNITTAPDGSLWYLGSTTSRRMHTGATGTAGSLGASADNNGSSGDITTGPDGNIWITKANGNHELLRVDPTTGATQAFDIPQGNVGPRQLTIGPDDNLWFTHTGFAQPGIMRYVIGTNTFTNFNLPAGSNPKGITAGDDGNLWFIRGNTNTIGRISPAGTGYTTFTATGLSFGPSPQEIAPGPGNTLWAAAGGSTDRIARVEVNPPSCDGRAITVDLNQGDAPTAGNDVILGTPGPDTIDGLAGNDRICSGAGGDTVQGGVGLDRLFGQNGADTLKGGADDDTLNGGKGTDTCVGNAGTDAATACEARRSIP